LRKPLIKKIFLLIILIYPFNLTSAQSEIGISRCGISEISSSDFLLSYSIKNTFDPELFSKLQVTIPFEKYIVQGSIENGLLHEKDFLYSQLNIDLNGDTDLNDTFTAKFIKSKLTIDNIKISPLTKSTSDYNVFIPFNETENFNVNRITPKGKPFTLRKFSTTPPEITIGLNTENDIEFKTFGNSQLLIEVIPSGKSAGDNLLIDDQKPFIGNTNEKDLTGGENSYRFITVKNITINNNTASGELKIEKIVKPFSLRITYYFGISKNLILMNQKIIKVN